MGREKRRRSKPHGAKEVRTGLRVLEEASANCAEGPGRHLDFWERYRPRNEPPHIVRCKRVAAGSKIISFFLAERSYPTRS